MALARIVFALLIAVTQAASANGDGKQDSEVLVVQLREDSFPGSPDGPSAPPHLGQAQQRTVRNRAFSWHFPYRVMMDTAQAKGSLGVSRYVVTGAQGQAEGGQESGDLHGWVP